ncbi:TetR/AcrR family transcriptional regulator [Paraburkholderia sp. CNPSo 3274]|uniref:TetR/AcrR family transcriptional regulator n=1 Tax=Paraburkholderia sp. CNPSo 3274 TaxID=2940932 RepID=UPI0020B8C31F|nr:TetR/AcrR family transcriptional regulator [Paraburkholderia sp. CNPSo 3274]MCP3707662.1 TetR/AcrR family transcriptional regulator [Paraburkholderia sp. CNPSo 3274]
MGIVERKDRELHAKHAVRAHDQRERILDAARRIVMSEGLVALSMRKIADAIGYSPASLYLYFAGRDEIAEALGREGYAQLLAQLEPLALIADARERLHALAHAYVAYGCDHPQTYGLIFMAHKVRSGHVGPAARRQRDARDAADAAGAPEAGDALACGAQLFAATLSVLTPASGARIEGTLLAQSLWATLHGMVMLTLARAGSQQAAPGPLIDATLDAWFGARAAAATLPGAQAPGVAS